MVISKIMLKDFKSYKDTVEIKFGGRFNVIIGENNIGKSTIFEALLLWEKCYNESLTSNKKNFYSQSVPLYISFDELYFLRITKDEDLFYGNKRTCEIGVEFSEENSEENFYLTFSLTKPSIENAYVRVQRMAPEQFDAFKEKMDSIGTKLTEFLFIQQTELVAKVLAKEPYMFPGQIRKKIEKGRSHEVLRNKILSSDIELLTERMKRVLDCDFDFKVPTRTAREKEEYINLYVTQNGKKIDVGLQGSGFLQVAEIFSSMAIMDNALNVLLIDEPDSHISPRIQNKLLDCLKEISNVQVFVITHNDNFVSELAAEDIIFINSENKNTGHIEALNDINIDVLHSSLGGVITGLTRLQKNKRIIFTEGDDDIAYFGLRGFELFLVLAGGAFASSSDISSAISDSLSAGKEIFLECSLEIPKNLRFNSAMVSSRFAMVWRRSRMVFCMSSPFFVRSAIVLFCCSMIVRKVLISLCRLLLFDMIYHLFISTVIIKINQVFRKPADFMHGHFDQ